MHAQSDRDKLRTIALQLVCLQIDSTPRQAVLSQVVLPQAVLPQAVIIEDASVLDLNTLPLSGGYGDVCWGKYRDKDVALKRFRNIHYSHHSQQVWAVLSLVIYLTNFSSNHVARSYIGTVWTIVTSFRCWLLVVTFPTFLETSSYRLACGVMLISFSTMNQRGAPLSIWRRPYLRNIKVPQACRPQRRQCLWPGVAKNELLPFLNGCVHSVRAYSQCIVWLMVRPCSYTKLHPA